MFWKTFFIASRQKWNQYTCACTSVQKIADDINTLQSFKIGHHLHPQVLYRVLFSIVLSIILSIKVNHIIPLIMSVIVKTKYMYIIPL